MSFFNAVMMCLVVILPQKSFEIGQKKLKLTTINANMRSNKFFTCTAAMLLTMSALAGNDDARLTTPLADKAWDCSVWLSLVCYYCQEWQEGQGSQVDDRRTGCL